MKNSFTRALGAGIVAGMRTFMAPALVSDLSKTRASSSLNPSPGCELLANGLKMAAAGELLFDKLPWAPDRISTPSLTARAVSGAVCGAVVYRQDDESPATGALVGAIAAVASAYAMFYIRREIRRKLPDPIVAVAEDAIAALGGYALIRN